MATAGEVIGGTAAWSCEQADAVAWLRGLPDDSVDLLFTSPPYLAARTYSRDDVARDLDSWVAWMMEVVRAARPKVKGLIAVNCEGQTRNYAYQPAPYLLAADLHRAGFNLRKPPIFRRVGIPGSGGPDWLRNDYEPIICLTRSGKLPWSDNTACGHPPKWAPGGEMSHRLSDGTKRNQWGMNGTQNRRKPTGERQPMVAPSHAMTTKTATKGTRNGDAVNGEYAPPVLANPGNVTQATYTAEEVAEMMGQPSDVLAITVGGGNLGHPLAHDNEAPFPLDLPAFFVKSFCPPGGIVADCFCGSGTTLDAAIQHGRRGIGCDIRASQIALCERRMRTVTPGLFA